MSAASFYAIGLAALYVAYLFMLGPVMGQELRPLLLSALANVAPLGILGFAAREILRRFVLQRAALIQVAAHVGLACVFSLLWFWLLMVFLGLVAGDGLVEFIVRPFPDAAAAWQMFQGLTVYGLVAAIAYAESATSAAPTQEEQHQRSFRFFVKQGEELRPLNPDDVIVIRGADDYSQVVTPAVTHLVRLSLGTLGERLGERFIRVHRSCLVNVDKIERAEPAGGGRMLVHMDNGDTIASSRAGAKLLRERAI